MTNLEINWLAISIALTTATQLRLPGIPVGVGEIVLLLWMLSVGIRILLHRSYLITSVAKIVIFFWIAVFTCLTLGMLVAYFMDVLDPGPLRDLFAFVFASLFSILFIISISSQKDKQIIHQILSRFIKFTIFVQAILFFIPVRIPFFQTWYESTRFQGWSNNPNQLAFLSTAIPFFSLYLYKITKEKHEKKWYTLSIFLAFMIGSGTQSDSLSFGWYIAIFFLFCSYIYRTLTNYAKTHFRGFIVVIFKQITLLIMLLIGLISAFIFSEKINAIASEVYDSNSQGEDRLKLWANGIDSISRSPLFGLGPGAHSGEREPIFYVQEAHNAFIDWTASSGIIGLICYLTLLFWVGWKAWKKGYISLVAALISVVGYTTFAYMLRHIILWFYVLTILEFSTHSKNHQRFSKNY
ncbi:O-antigen ligase family protein [Fischerella sp. PCC 9605]|uniref:O-antigen ligase family protein n=1 Tax=Fischerella sp. PCC 9605 TaxID=1173024 RepID=UPI0004B68CD4|nr:O-antigen ligase family protein [Fischerella sp. PCC 9605]